jgi:hypothetical protein
MQRHPQPDTLRGWVHLVVDLQVRQERLRQRFYQQAFWYLRRNQNEQTIATILMSAVLPPDPSTTERLPHRAVQASADRYLIRIGPGPMPETFNVNNNNRPVNG